MWGSNMAVDMCRRVIHNSYNKLQDIILSFNRDYQLKMCVKLNRVVEDKNGNSRKSNYYSEYKYNDPLSESGFGITIIRSYMPYLNIESIKPAENGRKIAVTIIFDDMYYIKKTIIPTEEWFNLSNGIFAKNDKSDKLYIPERSRHIVRVNLKFGGYIEVSPTIVDNEMSSEQIVGVSMVLGDGDIMTFIDVDRYLAFIEYLKEVRLYESAQNMLACIPSLGLNQMSMSRSSNNSYNDNYESRKNRFLT
jgi:hypothetical protein